jgi:molybdenum cofactor cytidylyltransferase
LPGERATGIFIAMQTPCPVRLNLAVVLLAAGQSTRMGQAKLLLPWGETSILGHHLQSWQSLGATQIAVVCRPEDAPLERELDRLGLATDRRIHNPQAAEGMFSSILAAARWGGWNASTSHWAIVLGDQPQMRPETLAALLAACANEPSQAHQPSRHGQPRHPVVLPALRFRSLADPGIAARTFKEFLALGPVVRVEMDDPGLDLDIDTPQDYRQALRLKSAVQRRG